jgi:hypothetical protein
MTGTMDKRIKLIFLGFILLVFAIIFSLAITRKESVNNKTELSTKTEMSAVKFNIRDLAKHGISLIAPSDPILTGNRKPVTNNPYSIVLKNDSGRPIVGYSIKWECFDGTIESTNRDMSHDVRTSHILGVVLTYGEESKRRTILNMLQGVIRSHSNYFISEDTPARPLAEAVEDIGTQFDDAALAEIRAACPVMTVTLDGIFFDDGTFVGPDTTKFFDKVKTQLNARYELLKGVQNALQAGKDPNDIFRELEQIRDREGQPQGGEMTTTELRSYFRNKYAQDVLGKREMWGSDKALEDVHQMLSRPWAKLRKL